MGRTALNRNIQVLIRVNEREKEILDLMAKKQDRSITEYIRETLFHNEAIAKEVEEYKNNIKKEK